MVNNIVSASYLIASILFVFSIRGLSSPETARRGNILGIIAMLITIAATLYSPVTDEYKWVVLAILAGAVIGIISGMKVKMTALPQMVALLNGVGGLTSVLVSLVEIRQGGTTYITSSLGLIIGGIAFTGSFIAFGKLQGIISGKAVTFFLQKTVNLSLLIAITVLTVMFAMTQNINYFYALTAVSLIFGVLAVIPIGGADMPVVISFLNSYTGWAAVFVGFSLNSDLLIIVGSMVGASGAILSYIMSKAMNRSLTNVILGGFGNISYAGAKDEGEKYARTGSPEDAAFIMKNANKVIIVPGYGMAVAQAQHIIKEMTGILQSEGVEVKFAIHPVAGRMPGHMNVLLAEADIPYEQVFELEDINREFATADVAYVIGANDVTNPLAKTDPDSPIFGMPILEVEKAKTIFFVKRSLASGYSGVDNPLFYKSNTTMLYGDAKKVTEQVVGALEN
ncbi:MAG: NAD(P)(+) transhydrogenase (Re/Si-specific) subunit beta [Lactobacillaceae bacterium]|nr:NAD(P)(+) transhydrogenase (Re/Si-specific) subunit beta [Lactobacillaceae bacterium]